MSAALDPYVNNVRNLSSQGNFAQLCDYINKSTEVLSKHVAHLDNVLATLDMQQHSLGILGILCVKYNQSQQVDIDTLLLQSQEFIYMCNGEHVRYSPESFTDLCRKFTQKIVEKSQAPRGIAVLIKAIQKIQLHSAQLISIHCDLLQLCLLAKNFKPALQFLDTDITDISKEGGHFDTKDFLLYYYYGGMIYAALKNYSRALYFFETVITIPSMAVSHVMLEAYKKYILISLILHGKIPTLPKYTSQVVSRYIKPLCQPYHDLGSAYASNSPSGLSTVANKHHELFLRDKNLGLLKQCILSIYKKNIQRLTKTFLTLSLSDMASRVQLSTNKEAERHVLHMIEDGEIYATINQKDGMVRFHDNPEKYNSAAMQKQLDEQISCCILLNNKLRDMDREITVNPQYVQKVQQPSSHPLYIVSVTSHLVV